MASLKNGSKLMRCSICFRTRKSPWSAVCAEALLEPLSRSLASAQAEEDEISPRAAAALDRSRSSLARGEGISHEEITRQFGLQTRAKALAQSASQCDGHPRPAQ